MKKNLQVAIVNTYKSEKEVFFLQNESYSSSTCENATT